jgi:hypothetical protein
MLRVTTEKPELQKFVSHMNRFVNRPEFIAVMHPRFQLANKEITEHFLLYGCDNPWEAADIVARVDAKMALMEIE